MKVHLKEKKEYSCEVCRKNYSDKHCLLRHMKVHTQEKPYPCEVCSKNFAQKSDLKVHSRVHTREKPYSCEVCCKSFSVKASLDRHSRVHTKEKPYSCEVCSKTFSQGNTLKEHMRVHTKERPYSCEVCGRAFSKRSGLRNHRIIHTKEKPYSCEVCDKKFSLRSCLKVHLRLHSEKPYYCGDCSRYFSDSERLKRHMMIHTKEKPYSCEVCGKNFSCRSYLRGHMRVHKKRENSSSCDVVSENFTGSGDLKEQIICNLTKYKPFAYSQTPDHSPSIISVASSNSLSTPMQLTNYIQSFLIPSKHISSGFPMQFPAQFFLLSAKSVSGSPMQLGTIHAQSSLLSSKSGSGSSEQHLLSSSTVNEPISSSDSEIPSSLPSLMTNEKVDAPDASHTPQSSVGNIEDSNTLAVYKEILREVKQIRYLQEKQADMLELLLRKSDSSKATENSMSQFKLDLPAKTESDIIEINSSLDDCSIRAELLLRFQCLGGSDYRDHAKRILRHLMTDQVAELYSCFESKDKNKFCSLEVSAVVVEAVVSGADGVTRNEVEEIIKNWLKHANERKINAEKK